MYSKIILVQVRGHAIFEVVLTNRQPPASHNFIHHPRGMTPTILSRTIWPQLLHHVQISTEYHLPVHGLPSVLRRVPLGSGSSRSHSLYHHQSQPEHFPQLRTPCIILFIYVWSSHIAKVRTNRVRLPSLLYLSIGFFGTRFPPNMTKQSAFGAFGALLGHVSEQPIFSLFLAVFYNSNHVIY